MENYIYDTDNIQFIDGLHEDFFLDMLSRSKRDDVYHRAFFYLMGLTAETRNHITNLFKFEAEYAF